MEKYHKTDDKIQLGYDHVKKNELIEACDIWLDAWEDIKAIFTEEKLGNLDKLDKKYSWHEFLVNFVQDLEMELGNAGQEKEEYHRKRINYCEEMLETLDGSDSLTIENTKRAIAESYYALGDSEECDRLYTNWLEEDPHWGWGYIAWSDCYGFGTNKIKPNQARAEKIIRMALEKEEVRDREDVLMRAAEVYGELGQKEKAKELEKEERRLRRLLRGSIKPVKIGRNEPCPCGSGKKYKKCCGAQ